MQYRRLGKTGVAVSALGLGGESALYKHSDKAVQIILRALDLGINYYDSAELYEQSLDNYGEVIPYRRSEMFMASKIDKRDANSAWRQLERSLTRLRVNSVDLLQVHHLDFIEEVDQIFAPGGAIEMLRAAKEQGLTRFIGVTGHSDPDVLMSALQRYPFDTILMALNAGESHLQSFQERLLPLALRQGIGVIGMKVMARGKLFPPLSSAEQAIRYVLTLPVSNIIVGVMNEDQLDRNVEIVNNFQPYSVAEMQALEAATEPYANKINFYRKDVVGRDFPATTPSKVL